MVEERVSQLNYKPVFQRFVEANTALLECYESHQKDDLLAMGAKMDQLCANEKTAIKQILASNEMTMTQLVKDRVNVLKALHSQGIVMESRRDE